MRVQTIHGVYQRVRDDGAYLHKGDIFNIGDIYICILWVVRVDQAAYGYLRAPPYMKPSYYGYFGWSSLPSGIRFLSSDVPH